MTRNIYDDYGHGSAKTRKSFFMKMVDIVLLVGTIIVAVMAILTFATPYVNPARAWFFPVLGLVAPATYLAALLLMLYWIIRWKWIPASVMMLFVVMGLFKLSLFWHFDFRKDYGSETFGRGTLKMITYNICDFYSPVYNETMTDSVALFIREQNPDIFCLQEFNPWRASQSKEFNALLETYDYATLGLTRAENNMPRAEQAIFSRHKILRSGVVLTPQSSVWADILVGDDTIRVFNNHLHSTNIKKEDNDFLTGRRLILDHEREDKIKSIISRFRATSVLRSGQVDSIAMDIDKVRTRKIVCGDFNDTPMSYAYRVMSEGLQDAFSEQGSGYSHTYHKFLEMLRIDYVLSSPGLEVLSYDVAYVPYSDHYPVIVRLRKN